jgi:hypothetical protein
MKVETFDRIYVDCSVHDEYVNNTEVQLIS